MNRIKGPRKQRLVTAKYGPRSHLVKINQSFTPWQMSTTKSAKN